jgi:hypothetical protein
MDNSVYINDYSSSHRRDDSGSMNSSSIDFYNASTLNQYDDNWFWYFWY